MEEIYKTEKIYNIYKIQKYNTKKENSKIISGDIDYICEKIKKDKAYHLCYSNEDDVIIFLDIDHIHDEQEFYNIVDYLCDYFDIEFDERDDNICYTKSIKENNELSYHISIPKFYSKCKNLKHIFEHFKLVYPQIQKYIDTSIYKTNNLFRLPNQTNEVKKYIHEIINGTALDFIINYIPVTTKEYIDSKLYIFNKNKIQSDILDNKIKIIPKILDVPNMTKIDDLEYKLFNSLSISRFDDREQWIKIGCLIYSLYKQNGLSLYIELSKKSDKFKNEVDVINTYNSFHLKKYTIKTLYYLSKIDNPEYFNSIIPKKIITEKQNVITIDKRYLLDNNKLDDDDILTNNINNFFTNNSLHCMSIKSPYDTGKTQMIKSIINKYQPVKVLFISYRVSLSVDLYNNFKTLNFKSYLDKDFTSNRLIIQIESLTKLLNNDFIDEYTNFVKEFDLIVVDEIESILSQFSSPTFKNESKTTYNYLTELLKSAKKCIFLDGDICDRGYSFINSISENQINILNVVKFNKKIYNIVNDRDYFINDIIDKLNNNNKIVVVCQSRRESENFYKLLNDEFPNKKISVFTSLSNDNDKKADVNTSWLLDCLIYSPVFEAGVSFDLHHYNYIYGILCNGSNSQRAFMQMMSRVRKIEQNNILILNDKLFKLNEINHYINYDDMQEHIKTLNIYPMEIQYIIKDNVKIQHKTFDNYTRNYIYNEIENYNKSSYYFLSKLKDIIENKGHIFNYIENVEKCDDKHHEKGTNELYNEILNANDININEYELIESKKKNNECKRHEKIESLKYYYINKLCLSKLNINIIKQYYNKTYLINNFISIIDITNYKQNDEAQNIKNYNKLLLIKQLLLDFNISNIFDSNYNISEIQFNNYFDYSIINNKLFNNESSIFYNITKFNKELLTNKKKLGIINSIFANYSLKLSSLKKKSNGYVLEILNNIDEIIKQKISNQNYKINDANNIFSCNKCDLIELY